MRIKITADSTIDLSKDLCEKYEIGVVPICIMLDDQLFQDGINITTEDIYEFVEKTKILPKTSATTTVFYEEFFKEQFDAGYDAIIHFSLSSEMSVTHQNAKSLMETYENLFVVDSKSLSTGIGLQAIYAAELVKAGKLNAKEIYEKILERVDHAQASFILDKLMYLYRGGRCNAISVLGANLLKIKPAIEVNNGKMGMARKYMGNFQSSLMKYVKDTLEKYNNPDLTRVFITHTKIDNSLVELVKNYLKENTQFKEIIETTAGCTVTSHCGPNTIGILYYNDGDKEHY